MNSFKIRRSCLYLLLATLGCTAVQTPGEKPADPAGYLKEGATLEVSDPFLDEAGGVRRTLLEELKETAQKLDAEMEKNALLARELMNLREGRDTLKQDLDSAKTRSTQLQEEIAALKGDLADQETRLNEAFREKRDLLEKLVDLKLEKTKIERELLKVKIAALSGEG